MEMQQLPDEKYENKLEEKYLKMSVNKLSEVSSSFPMVSYLFPNFGVLSALMWIRVIQYGAIKWSNLPSNQWDKILNVQIVV